MVEFILAILISVPSIYFLGKWFDSLGHKHTTPELIVGYSVRPVKVSKPVKKVKPAPDPLIGEAKDILVTMGYSATESKKMLEGISASTVEEYINEAMKRVKI